MKKIFFLVFCLISSFYFTACQPVKKSSKPQILVSIPSYEKLLQEVLKDDYEVICVVPEGFNPHYFEVRPNDLNRIQNPKFWFGVNESFEPKLLESLKGRFGDLQYFNLVDSIEFSKIEEHHDCHHHHEAGSSCHHDENMIDNHIWMSPKLMIKQIQFIQTVLPNLTSLQDERFSLLKDQLSKLDKNLHDTLMPYHGKALLVSHGSFAYFCKEYHLLQLTIEIEGKQPMPKDLENLVNQLKTSSIICVIAQPQFDQKGAIIIAEKLHKPLYTIDPYSKNYFEMMNDLQEKILRQK
jgi:zinc transport system substrate-binding protein